MKWKSSITLWLAIGLLAACGQRNNDTFVETRHGTSLQPVASPKLSAIDSFMWQQPDSALALLQDYFSAGRDVACNVSNGAHCDTLGGDVARYVSTNETFDHHYAHLLLAELLYKNDYTQTNRVELQQAVGYFDSLVVADTRGVSLHRFGRRDAPRASASNMSIAFLDARAHYINGVGYYERDSVVEACKEYLKALETMEGHFAEKELVGKRARFMTYTYNRLGDMFSEQFMMEPAINCYEQALVYCLIDPTSSTGVSNILYRLGKQYDKMDNVDKARQYYCQALELIPNTDNLVYRNILSSKALCDYQLGFGMEQSLNMLRYVISQTNDEKEQAARFLLIGSIFFEERMYDSAIYYLDPVYENGKNVASQIQATNYLHIIYENMGNSEKSNDYMRFLTHHRKTEGQNKALVSQLDHLFQNHQNQKKTIQAAQEQRAAVLKTLKTVIPIAIIVISIIVVIIWNKNKKRMALQKAKAQLRLEEKERQHEEAIEAERLAHHIEQAAISGRLKRSNKELRHLKEQIKQQDNVGTITEQTLSFAEEPVCRLIMERVNAGQFKSKVDYLYYKNYALDKEQLMALRVTADRHFKQFTIRLKKTYPELTKADLDYCCLYLLGLTDADVAALMQRAYNTVSERNGKLRKIFGNNNALSVTLWNIANDSASA